jgi:hypothetical protein
MNMTQKVARSVERTFGIPNVELGAAPFKISTGGSSRASRLTENEEASFQLDDRAAEHDLIACRKLLTRGFQVRPAGPQRPIGCPEAAASDPATKVVFIDDKPRPRSRETEQISLLLTNCSTC